MRILDWLIYLVRRLVAFLGGQRVTQITLVNPKDLRKFYPGCRLTSGAGPSFTVLRLKRGGFLVVAVDRPWIPA